MSFGFEIYDNAGRETFSVTDRLPRVLGYSVITIPNRGSSSGEVVFDAEGGKKFWYTHNVSSWYWGIGFDLVVVETSAGLRWTATVKYNSYNESIAKAYIMYGVL